MVASCFFGTDSADPQGRMLTNSIRAKGPSHKTQREVTAPAKMKNAWCVPRHAVSMGCLPLPLRVGSGPCASRKLMQLWLVYIVHREHAHRTLPCAHECARRLSAARSLSKSQSVRPESLQSDSRCPTYLLQTLFSIFLKKYLINIGAQHRGLIIEGPALLLTCWTRRRALGGGTRWPCAYNVGQA